MTSVTRYPSYVKKKSEPLIRDLFLEPASTSSMSAQLTTDFIKFLCFQKGQIPVTCSQMESHLSTTLKELDKKMDFSCMVRFIQAFNSYQRYLQICISEIPRTNGHHEATQK
jgi:hypothetical protein